MEESRNSVFDEELQARCAYATGYDLAHAITIMRDAFARGIAVGNAEMAAPDGGGEYPEIKTDIQDCHACWCDTCAKLEGCGKHREGQKADGIYPYPCTGCANGMRFRPQEEEPCKEYEDAASYNNE